MNKATVTLITSIVLLAAAPAAASAAPLYSQCPPVGNNDGCSQLVVAKRNGSFVVKADPNAPPLGYDGAEDTLVGVQNNSRRPLRAVSLASTTLGIFGFDGDGLCNPSQWPQARATTPPDCPGPQGFGVSGYEGPNAVFSNVSANEQTGTVVFPRPLPPGGSAYFGLEEAIGPGALRAARPGRPIATGLSVRRRNVASLQLICVGAARCRGRALVVVRSAGRRVTVGSAGVSIAGGETGQLRMKLNVRGRSLLRRDGRLLARVLVVLGHRTTVVGKLRFNRKR
jgi:hypothetical protein